MNVPVRTALIVLSLAVAGSRAIAAPGTPPAAEDTPTGGSEPVDPSVAPAQAPPSPTVGIGGPPPLVPRPPFTGPGAPASFALGARPTAAGEAFAASARGAFGTLAGFSSGGTPIILGDQLPPPPPVPPDPRRASALGPSVRGFKIAENQSPQPQ